MLYVIKNMKTNEKHFFDDIVEVYDKTMEITRNIKQLLKVKDIVSRMNFDTIYYGSQIGLEIVENADDSIL